MSADVIENYRASACLDFSLLASLTLLYCLKIKKFFGVLLIFLIDESLACNWE